MKRILAMLLCLLMVCSCALVSCGEEETETEANVETEAPATETETETETEETLQVEEGFAKNEDLLRLQAFKSYVDYTTNWKVDSRTGITIQDAIYNLNTTVADYAGTDFEVEIAWYAWADMDAYNSNIINSVQANGQVWDLIAVPSLQIAFLTFNGVLRNLNKVDSLDLTHSWYNQDLADAIEVNDQLFSVASYGAITTVSSIVRLFVNDDMLEDLKLDSVYPMVVEGTWTFDKLYEYQAAGSIENGNGTWAVYEDKIGIAFPHTKFMPSFVYACGITLTETDEAGNITIADLTTDKFVEIHDFTRDKLVGHYNGSTAMKGGAVGSYDTGNYFIQEWCLFWHCDGRNINNMRSATFAWGSVPIPMWDEDQGRYYTMNEEEMGIFCIPIDADKNISGALLDTYSWFGMQLVYPVYVEDVLYTKAASSEIAASMYDLMMDSLVYDFAYYYNIAMADGGYGSNSLFWRVRNHIFNLDMTDWITYWAQYQESFNNGLANLMVTLSNIAD